jgi:4-methylaminobutanoate oxidase (formaldehyde-forming)
LRVARSVDLGETVVTLMRSSYAGGLGFEVLVPTEQAALVFETLVAAGAAFGLRLAGTYALDALRVERGRVAWGHELEPGVTPYDVGLEGLCKEGRDFRGSAALASRAATTKVLALRVADPDAQLWGGEVVSSGGEAVGTVTSVGADYAAGGYQIGRAHV